jgi:hypothetical protein
VTFSPLQPKEVQADILWVPGHTSDGVVRELAKSWAGPDGKVVYCYRNFVTLEGGTGAYGTTRFSVKLANVWPETVPDRVTLDVMGERFPVLVLVKGRPRACFLCSGFGHKKADCPRPKCRYCQEEGHVVTDCPKKMK